MGRKREAGYYIVQEYLTKYPKAGTRTLTAKAYKDHPEVWTTKNACQAAFRRARGNQGVYARAKTKDKSHYRPNQKSGDPFGALPIGWTQLDGIVGLTIDGPCRALILADIHAPYHDDASLRCALVAGKKQKATVIVLDGDVIDCHALSRWQTDPRERDFPAEVAAVRGIFGAIRGGFPKARIIYKYGNHDERFLSYMICKAPELLDVDDFQLPKIFRCPEYDIEVMEERQVLRLGKLNVLHGHEYRYAISNPVNPARGLYLRAKANALCAHFHQSSHHSEMSLTEYVTSCWSIGCLCDLHPRYMPLNKWSHGFAIVDIDNAGAFSINNLRIIDGKIWS